MDYSDGHTEAAPVQLDVAQALNQQNYAEDNSQEAQSPSESQGYNGEPELLQLNASGDSKPDPHIPNLLEFEQKSEGDAPLHAEQLPLSPSKSDLGSPIEGNNSQFDASPVGPVENNEFIPADISVEQEEVQPQLQYSADHFDSGADAEPAIQHPDEHNLLQEQPMLDVGVGEAGTNGQLETNEEIAQPLKAAHDDDDDDEEKQVLEHVEEKVEQSIGAHLVESPVKQAEPESVFESHELTEEVISSFEKVPSEPEILPEEPIPISPSSSSIESEIVDHLQTAEPVEISQEPDEEPIEEEVQASVSSSAVESAMVRNSEPNEPVEILPEEPVVEPMETSQILSAIESEIICNLEETAAAAAAAVAAAPPVLKESKEPDVVPVEKPIEAVKFSAPVEVLKTRSVRSRNDPIKFGE